MSTCDSATKAIAGASTLVKSSAIYICLSRTHSMLQQQCRAIRKSQHVSPNQFAIRGVVMHVQAFQGAEILVVGNGATEAVVVQIPDMVGQIERVL